MVLRIKLSKLICVCMYIPDSTLMHGISCESILIKGGMATRSVKYVMFHRSAFLKLLYWRVYSVWGWWVATHSLKKVAIDSWVSTVYCTIYFPYPYMFSFPDETESDSLLTYMMLNLSRAFFGGFSRIARQTKIKTLLMNVIAISNADCLSVNRIYFTLARVVIAKIVESTRKGLRVVIYLTLFILIPGLLMVRRRWWTLNDTVLPSGHAVGMWMNTCRNMTSCSCWWLRHC